MNSKSRSRRWAMLAIAPVRRLSMATTESPRSSSTSHRCEPMNPAAPVTTIRAIALLDGGTALEQTPDEGQPHDLDVERHRPVLDVVEVVLDALLERGVAAPAVHLRPAGDAGLHLVAQHVLRDAVLELLDEERPLRAGTDDRHVALEDVPELRQLVQIEAAQPAPDRRRARVVVARPHRPRGVLGVLVHRADLV